jgi:DNA-binding response OmpR family regulator
MPYSSPTVSGDESAIKVLLIEDNTRLGELTARYLTSHGVSVTLLPDGTRGLAAALSNAYDLILLDLMLPGRDGVSVCQELRERCGVPIIMVTARSEEADRVLGLELGADDYVTKPFSARELLARIRAQVRRARGLAGPAVPSVVRVGRLVVDPARLEASLDGRKLPLTAYEFALLRVLAERSGRVLNREQLLDLAKGGSAEESFDRSIDVHISRLRQKLNDDPKHPRILKTIRGAGYMLTADGALTSSETPQES